MAVSRAICTGAKAPVTFARGRAAIKETGGSVARIALQTHCHKQQRSSSPPATPDQQQHTPRKQELASKCITDLPIPTHTVNTLLHTKRDLKYAKYHKGFVKAPLDVIKSLFKNASCTNGLTHPLYDAVKHMLSKAFMSQATKYTLGDRPLFE